MTNREDRINKWTESLKLAIQDSIDEELEKVVSRDDPEFMEMRKMTMPTIQFGGKIYKPKNKVAALCPPKWERGGEDNDKS